MKKIILGFILSGLVLTSFAEEINISNIKNNFESVCKSEDGIFTVSNNNKFICEVNIPVEFKVDNVTETISLKGEMIIHYNINEANKGISVENNVVYNDGTKESVKFTPDQWIEYFKTIKKWNEN